MSWLRRPRAGAPEPANAPGPPAADADQRLALYYSPWCGYCLRILALIEMRDLDVERKNVRAESTYLQELIGGTGRRTVPVLRITRTDGTERWLPESREITRYLREHGRAR